MGRIKIGDLPKDLKISRADMIKTFGGTDSGVIIWGGQEASLSGTGGVALLEYAKDAIQTAASNISGVGSLEIQAKKTVERKIGAMG